MTGTDGEASRVERPHRQTKPSAVLLAQSNSEQAALPYQAKAVINFRAAETARRAAERDLALNAARANITPSSSRATSPAPSVASTSHVPDSGKRARVEEFLNDEDSEDEERENAYINPKPKGERSE